MTRLAAALEPLSRARQDKVLNWVGIAAKTNAEIGHLIATLAPKAWFITASIRPAVVKSGERSASRTECI